MWYLLLRKYYEIVFAPLFLGILTIGICLDLSRNSCDIHWKIQSIIFCFSVRQKLYTWYLLIDLDLLSILLHLFPGMVFCYQNCSDLLWEFFFANSQTSASNFKSFSWSLEQFIQRVKGQTQFWKQNAFLTCSWKFLWSNILDQLEFKLEKIIGI